MSDGRTTGLETVLGNLQKFEALLENDRKEILAYAAAPVVDTVRSAAPVGSVTHRRYPRREKGAKRAAKGKGTVLTTYAPGNLKGSIEILTNLRRTDSIWVGPRGRRIKKGGPKKGDGYYALMVEQGTQTAPAQPFFYRSVAVAAPEVGRRIAFGFQVAANKYRLA